MDLQSNVGEQRLATKDAPRRPTVRHVRRSAGLLSVTVGGSPAHDGFVLQRPTMANE